jgi:predicted amidohydrolase
MKPLTLALAQYAIERVAGVEGFGARLDRLAAEAAARGAEMLVLPEYAAVESAGHYVATADVVAELAAVTSRSADLLAAMRAAAMRHRLWLAPGSLPMPMGQKIRNRAPLITPDGRVAWQEKRVMTRFETESWGISPGDAPVVFATPWGPIGLAICYDIEFPALVRAAVVAGAWLVLCPCCTDTMWGFNRVRLAARAGARENQCYVVIAPTVGAAPWLAALDDNHGYAAAFGPVDRGFPPDGVLARGALDEPGTVFVRLDPERLGVVRAEGGVRNHADWPPDPEPCPVRTPA